VPLGPESGPATGGMGRGDAVATAGQTVFLVGQAYVPGTMRAFVGGYFQRPGAEFTESDPAAGEVTFASGLSAGALVSFFYEVQRV